MRFGLSVLREVNGAEGLTSAAAGAKENKKEGGYLASDVLGKVPTAARVWLLESWGERTDGWDIETWDSVKRVAAMFQVELGAILERHEAYLTVRYEVRSTIACCRDLDVGRHGSVGTTRRRPPYTFHTTFPDISGLAHVVDTFGAPAWWRKGSWRENSIGRYKYLP